MVLVDVAYCYFYIAQDSYNYAYDILWKLCEMCLKCPCVYNSRKQKHKRSRDIKCYEKMRHTAGIECRTYTQQCRLQFQMQWCHYWYVYAQTVTSHWHLSL